MVFIPCMTGGVRLAGPVELPSLSVPFSIFPDFCLPFLPLFPPPQRLPAPLGCAVANDIHSLSGVSNTDSSPRNVLIARPADLPARGRRLCCADSEC